LKVSLLNSDGGIEHEMIADNKAPVFEFSALGFSRPIEMIEQE
jgi:hypothetical protein